jgi:hypothetical protein
MRNSFFQTMTSVALALASISSAQAEVIFNFVPTQFFGQGDRNFQVSVSDSVYTAAQSAPVTFGVFSVAGPFDPITIASVGPLSSDVTGTVTARTTSGDISSDISTVATTCNSAAPTFLDCRASFTSTAVRFNDTLSQLLPWQSVNPGLASSTITLASNQLAFTQSVAGFSPVSFTFDRSTNLSSWRFGNTSFGADGTWVVNATTIPVRSVPVPGSLALVLLGSCVLTLRCLKNKRTW